ncbi:MAG TPA: condensation domain-containing protein, partial [Blastocatellia bacterium]|nr:condensation domain-containing protein [Blastocatellia bacterium]
LDIDALERSLKEIIRRHWALRTVFTEKDGQPAQVVKESTPFAISVIDLSHMAKSEQDSPVLSLTLEEAHRPFDLKLGPLMRAILLRLGQEEHAALFTMHHIISDGWSMNMLVHEVVELYDAFSRGEKSPLPELPAQYIDYAVWQRDWLRGAALEKKLGYWKEQLRDLPTVLALPTDRPRLATQRFRGASRGVSLSQTQVDALIGLSRREQTTLFMTLLAAFKALLYRCAALTDIPIGTPVAGRNHIKLENLIGFFVNTLTLRTRFDGGINFCELLRRVRETSLGAYAHQDVPFEMLVEELQPVRSLSYTPLFQAMFTFQLEAIAANIYSLPGGLRVGPLVDGESDGASGADGQGIVKFDLTLSLVDMGQGYIGSFSYDADLFDSITIERMASNFVTLVDNLLADPDRPLAHVSLWRQEEWLQLLTEASAGAIRIPLDESLAARFKAQAAATPDAAAIIDTGRSISYRDLHKRSNQLAIYLCELGVGPEDKVAVMLVSSAESAIALLAAHKAGGAYVPLAPQSSPESVRQVMAYAGAKVLLTRQDLVPDGAAGDVRVVRLDVEWPRIAQFDEHDLNVQSNAVSLATLINAETGAGALCGVMLTHESLLSEALAIGKQCGLSEVDRVFCPYSFGGGAAAEIYAALLCGATWVNGAPAGPGSPTDLFEICVRTRTSVLMLPAGRWEQLTMSSSVNAPAAPEGLRLIVVKGRKVLKKHLAAWHGWNNGAGANGARAGIRVASQYQPAEAMPGAAWWEPVPLADGRAYSFQTARPTIPLGQAMPHARIFVLDRNMNPAPVGVVGELYLGGGVVARGYHQRPDLTATRYVPAPFEMEPGARLYRTGDLGRYLPDGSLELVGHVDGRMALNGLSFRLDEIESALLEHDRVQQALVKRTRAEGIDDLVAYIVGPSEAEVRSFAQRRLPDYMRPRSLVVVASLPLTVDGRVDRSALPVPDREVEGAAGQSTALKEKEKRVAIKRAELAARRSRLSADQQTALNQRLQRAREKPSASEAIPKRDLQGPAPLSFAQRRLWILDQLDSGSPLYNMPFALRLAGQIDSGTLERCMGEILRRHEALRTVFQIMDGEPVQIVQPAAPFTLPVIDLTDMDEAAREAEAQRLIREEAQRPFDLSRGPLLRAVLLKLGAEDHVALLNMHHIISDGWSMDVLTFEMTALYDAFAHDKPSPLSELPIQYADFAIWQRQWFQDEKLQAELNYWRKRLEGAPPVLDLPTDKPRTTGMGHRGAVHPINFSRQLSDALQSLAIKEDLTLFMLLLAGFNVLLYRYTGQRDILVGSLIAGRLRAETEKLIGFFVNTLVLRTQISGKMKARELLRQIRETCLEAYAHQQMPFETLVEQLQPDRSTNRTPLFQVMLTLQNTPGGGGGQGQMMRFGGAPGAPSVSVLESGSGTAKFELTLGLAETESGLQGGIEYRTDLFEATTIERMAVGLERMLTALAGGEEQPLGHWPLL